MKSTVLFRSLIIAVIALSLIVCCLGLSVLADDGETGTETGTTAIVGDLNGDGVVNAKDVVVIRQYLANFDFSVENAKPYREDADFDLDGDTDLQDLHLLRKKCVELGTDDSIYKLLVKEQGLLELNNGIVLRAREDGSFKVILISDVQCYNEKGLVNSGTLDVIEAMIEAEDPDLVLFVGDNVWSRNSKDDLRAYLDVMAKPMEDRQIPWAHIYGNHDAEDNDPWYWAIDKEEQQEVYERYSYCISKSGPEDVPGVGNYVLPVLAHDSDKIVYNIWALDSMMYRSEVLADVKNTTGATNYFYGKYEGMSEAHTNWYVETSKLLEAYNGGETIPAMMYFHIPLQESYYAWADAKTNGSLGLGATNLIGTKAENISAPVINCGLFDAIVERGDVKVIANGHDHENDFSVDYKGVTLAYCGSAGLEAYHNYDIAGARVVNFTPNGKVSTNMSYMNDLPEYNNHDAIINMVIDKNGVTNGATAHGRFELTSIDKSSNPKSIVYEESLNRYVVNFTGGTTTPSVYNYSAENLTPILYDNFSYEIAFKVDDVNFSGNYVGLLDFEEGGGFGLNVYKNGSSTTTYVLKAEVSAGHTEGWNSDDVILNVGEWYHVVYTYNYTDYRTRSTAVYVNGMKVAGTDKLYERTQLYRKPAFSGRAGEEYICIGGCAQAWQSSGVKSQGMNGFTGSIALCNLYPNSTTSDAAWAMSNAFWGEEKKMPDILNLQINSDGSVVNGAQFRPALNSATQSGGTKEVVYDETLGKSVISFVANGNPSSYTLPAGEFEGIFADGFAYEVVVKVTDISKITGSVTYHGVLDYEEAGGFGLNIHKGTDGKFRLESEIAFDNGSRYWEADTTGNLEFDTWYHCVFVYDGSSTALYINGVKVDGAEGLTSPYHPTGFGSASPYICIGGCAAAGAPNAGVQGMTGSIAAANIFCDPITAEEVAELFAASGVVAE